MDHFSQTASKENIGAHNSLKQSHVFSVSGANRRQTHSKREVNENQ